MHTSNNPPTNPPIHQPHITHTTNQSTSQSNNLSMHTSRTTPTNPSIRQSILSTIYQPINQLSITPMHPKKQQNHTQRRKPPAYGNLIHARRQQVSYPHTINAHITHPTNQSIKIGRAHV